MDFNPEFKPQMLTWYENFKKASTAEMTKEVTSAFLGCSINENKEMPDEFKKVNAYKILVSRGNFLGLTLTPGLIAFLIIITEGVPGRMVMYLSALKCYRLTSSENTEVCCMETLTNISPDGFPSEESLKELWNYQKIQNTVGTDNFLDLAFI